MQTFQTQGTFKVEPTLTLVAPLLSIESIYYNFKSLKATIVVLMESATYSHSRELEPIDFIKELTNAEIKSAVQAEFVKMKI
jgi:hypothetical protein